MELNERMVLLQEIPMEKALTVKLRVIETAVGEPSH